MADRSFGVREINIVGSAGTPTISSPNNINLNGINVAISTDLQVGRNVSIVGVITVTSLQTQNLNVTGISTFRNNVYFDDVDRLEFGTSRDNNLYLTFNGINGFVGVASTGSDLYIQTPSGGGGVVEIRRSTFLQKMATFTDGGSVDLYYNNALKFKTTDTGVVITGILTATSFVGNGSGLTNLPASYPTWTIGSNGSSDYTFTGIGFTVTTNDPVLYLARGQKYAFDNQSGGSHPFQIRTSNGGSAYNSGVTNNGASTGIITFEVPFDAPNSLYYQCTVHSTMGNTINIYPTI